MSTLPTSHSGDIPGATAPEGERIAAFSDSDITRVAERRKLLARHAYAMSFDGAASSYNWALTDIFEPYVSYDYWWRWATDAQWYSGSTLRLDPVKFPKEAPGTRELWGNFAQSLTARGA